MINTGAAIAPARHRQLQNSLMQNSLNRFLDETFGPFATQSPVSEEPGAFTTWAPLCDIYETDKNIVIKMELPEVKKENISVTFDNNVLTITGERKAEEEEKGQSYHRQERSYGQFLRSFTLPPFVDTKNITAESKEGMLSVTLPKVEEAKAKQIEVKVQLTGECEYVSDSVICHGLILARLAIGDLQLSLPQDGC